jgi:hypothetical protein
VTGLRPTTRRTLSPNHAAGNGDHARLGRSHPAPSPGGSRVGKATGWRALSITPESGWRGRQPRRPGRACSPSWADSSDLPLDLRLLGLAWANSADVTLDLRLIGSPAAPFLTLRISSTGLLQLTVTGDAGHTYTLATSTNLIHWTNARTFTAQQTPFELTDLDAPTTPVQFYRVSVDSQ